MARRPNRPGRTLSVFLVGVAILYGLVAIAGVWKPALGLDLQGGTRITLIAQGDPSSESLEEARGIIDQRVNARGVTEAEVTTQGSRFIVVEIPGENRRDLVEVVERQAQLRFRTVACVDSGSGASGPCATAATPTVPTDPNPSLAPSASASTEPSANPSDKASGKPDDKASASPKNRAPFVLGEKDKKNATAKPSKSPSATDSATPSDTASPSETASPTDTASPTEAPVDEPADSDDPAQQALDFITNPGQAAIDEFNAFTCPSTKPIVDNPDKPLVTCGTEEEGTAGTKFLLSPAAIEGTDLKSADAVVPAQQVQWIVQLSLGGEGKKVFADLSRAMIDGSGTPTAGAQFAVVLDGQVISSPGFDGVISDGNAQISGTFTETTAKSLATSLKFGALPISFEKDVSSEDIGPSLAGNQLQAGITAGILGLLLVMIYCLIYYRGLGLVVLASLVVAAAITYAMVLLLGKTAGFTLTLPGIAGLIIGVGVTADSFIIFFERIRDEMREGRSMRAAVESGWKRARKTRLAANVVSLLSASVLYLFATGVVKGFGFALGLSTLIDLAILFWFTKPLVSCLARLKFFNGGGELSGLSRGTLGIEPVAQPVSQGGKA
ncbi:MULTISPECIES: protein translocase subunit SecD [unclassified Nocardioides]|uniref:protein translocase subunit SecD n=1 Tax=unclassified Nocardioides TaxID=2615069 RepID=UPI0009F0ECF7|nr:MULTISPECIES: protein translocase subunit SecD [unclassified Nocardioides]GAW49452.1 preprotein translocase subunit SecD [Nocardioides sp. PD653-B2]GAW55034.1 preprotein translocase subunit SecD [Nocardioides sp. PD653]